jgi:uncharacterized protein
MTLPQLTVNYSPESSQLLEAGVIQFDRYKLPDWPHLIAEVQGRHPFYVHFSLSAGRRPSVPPDWGWIREILAASDTPFVNLHLDAPADLDPLDDFYAQQVVGWMIADVEQACRQVGADRVVVENPPWQNTLEPWLLTPALPEVTHNVLQETGCHFLLDLAHAAISAHSAGIPVQDWISSLPIKHLVEMHITGIHSYNGYLRDHLGMTPTDWALFDWALANIKLGAWHTPAFISFEYGGFGSIFRWRSDPAVLQRDVPQLLSRIGSLAFPDEADLF